jgi:hypothetical protein
VIPYLPCFGEWLITSPLLAFLPFLCLFTDSSALKPAPCPAPSSGAHSVFPPPVLLLLVIQFC